MLEAAREIADRKKRFLSDLYYLIHAFFVRKCEKCDILLCHWKGEALEDAALAAGRKAMDKGADAPTAARLAKEVLKDMMMLLSNCIVAPIRMSSF